MGEIQGRKREREVKGGKRGRDGGERERERDREREGERKKLQTQKNS